MIDETWRKSSYSGNVRQSCVEARSFHSSSIGLRDAMNPDLGHLTVPSTEWRAFLHAVRRGELD